MFLWKPNCCLSLHFFRRTTVNIFRILTFKIINIKMSVEKVNDCPKSTYRKPNKTTIKLDYDSSINLPKWDTETNEIFVPPKVDEVKIGKRRELLMKYFRMRASKDALEKIIGDPPLPESACFTEYIDNFCDNHFVPILEKSEFDVQKIANNPLYNGNVQTYYKEQFDKKNLKVTKEFRNEKRPFVRRSLFTTPPELALDEPKDGF